MYEAAIESLMKFYMWEWQKTFDRIDPPKEKIV